MRRALIDHSHRWAEQLDFYELAPENWCRLGNAWRPKLHRLRQDIPFTAHGLSLSLGGVEEFDSEYLAQVRDFLDEFAIDIYSEHLSFTGYAGALYELFPLPFTQEAAAHVARRIDRVQEAVRRPLVIEHVSYYIEAPGSTMSEPEFVGEVLKATGARLLLDVNNLYVNKINHGTDPHLIIDWLHPDQVAYLHIAGHSSENQDPDNPGETILVDTHGADVCDAVWSLLDYAYAKLGVQPTLLERDANFPDTPRDLLEEVDTIRRAQHKAILPEQQIDV